MKALLALFFVASAVLAAGQSTKVLIIEGLSNHDWQHRVEIVRAILDAHGGFEVDVTVTPSVAGDPAWDDWNPDFSSYDVVMSGYNNLGGGPRWPAAVETAFEQYVANGGGFVGYHEANNAFENWPEYNEIIGLGWRNASFGKAIIVEPDESLTIVQPGNGLSTGHGARVDVEVKRLGNHPLHAGLPASWMAADLEVYRYARGPANNLTVLSYAKDPSTQLQFPIEWAVSYGSGRVYMSTYGHVWSGQAVPTGTRCAAFQTVLARALKWCAGHAVPTTTPADFPTPTAISLRDHAEGVSGLAAAAPVGPFNNGLLPSQALVPTDVTVEPAFANLSWDSPMVANPWPGSPGDLVIAELDGRVYKVPDDDATTTRDLVLDIRDRAWYYDWSGTGTKHGGLQSLVFHPRFGLGEGKDHIYTFYLHNQNDAPNAGPPYFLRVARFTWDAAAGSFDPASELIMINQYDVVKGHDGTGLAFGADGFLYVSVGDEGTQNGGSTPHAQKIDDRFRSGLWRIDVDMQGGAVSRPINRQLPAEKHDSGGNYQAGTISGSYTQGYYIPLDNPWVDPGNNGAVLEEFYALGLRQPHRMTFDAPTGTFWIGDVGGGQREEVNVVDAPAQNYQWNYREGFANGFRSVPDPLIGIERPPVHDYDRGTGNCVIGGHVYRGSAIPGLAGKYLFGDNGTQRIYAIDYDFVTKTNNGVTEIGQARAGNIWTGICSFGTDTSGEPLVMQLGAGQAGGGLISRITPEGGATTPDYQFPPTLSATGLFADLPNLAPAAGLIPYSVNMPFWAAGVDKQRWVLIPNDGTPDTPGEQIVYNQNDEWQLPVGSVLVKNFRMPGGGNHLETRILVHGTDGAWGGVTYKWRPDQLDADLLEAGATEPLTIGTETFDYLYPSRSQCAVCHTRNAGEILGFKTRQLNSRLTYPSTGKTANQVETLSQLGFIPQTVTEVTLRNAITSAILDDTGATDEHWTRSYLDSSCSQCHRPEGNRSPMDLRLTTPLAYQQILCADVIDDLGLIDPEIVKPQDPDNSVMYARVNSNDGCCAMPPLAKGRIDQDAVTRLRNWILNMDPDACSVVADSSITWTTPPTSTINENDIDLSGSFVSAGSYGTAGGLSVPAGGETIVFDDLDNANATATKSGETSQADAFIPPGAIDANFHNVMDGFAYDGPNPKVLTLGNLIPGRRYQVQLFVADDRSCCSGRTQKWSDSATDGLGNETAVFTHGSNSHVIGEFTAIGTTRQIYGHGVGQSQNVLTAYVLRELADTTDTDGDGMLDSWEDAWGFDKNNPADAAADADGDGLDNLAEFNRQTDPLDPDTDGDQLNDGQEVGTYGTDPLVADTDGDGLPDGTETGTYGTNPLAADSDGDGFDDGFEVAEGTDPNDAASQPEVATVTILPGLMGGDLTDPEDDGVEGAGLGTNFNWVNVTASSEPYFDGFGGSEGAFDLFDNQVGSGGTKWCCSAPPQHVTVEFAQAFALTHFTVSSGNDVPERDPLVWSILGSNDGVTFDPIFVQDDPSASLWTDRNQTLRIDLPRPSGFYRYFRYEVTQTGGSQHQLNEIEFFGQPFGPVVTVRPGLLGGDLTDPEDDGVEGPGSGSNFNWLTIDASQDPFFGGFGGSEGAFDLFDNTIGGGDAKWCCGAPPLDLTVRFAQPFALTHITATSGNDTPDRDPRVWAILGSNDGVNFDPIFVQDQPLAALWTARDQTLRIDLPEPAPFYTHFRYEVTQTGGSQHQLSELELFGIPWTRLDDIAFNDSGHIELTFTALAPGISYQLRRSQDLEDWVDLGIPVSTAAGGHTWVDPLPPADRAFYQLYWVQP